MNSSNVELSYRPYTLSPIITRETTTVNANGDYAFPNLSPGTYTVRARRPNFTYVDPPSFTLQGNRIENISPSISCTYTTGPINTVPAAGEDIIIPINTGDGCTWTPSSSEPWIVIRSGGSNPGPGTMELRILPNNGGARTGSVTIAGRPDPILIQQAAGTGGTQFEADVSPRPSGDGTINSTDVVQLRRFATGLDTPTPGSGEAQRADCAPRTTFGDGMINSADVVQGRRYATGLDPLTNIGGPAIRHEGDTVIALIGGSFGTDGKSEKPWTIGLSSAAAATGERVTVYVELDRLKGPTAAGFTLAFDPTKLKLAAVTNAIDETTAVLTVNDNIAGAGRVGILVDSDRLFGSTRLVAVTFIVAADAEAGETVIRVAGDLSPLSLSDSTGDLLPVRASDGIIRIQ